MPKRLTKSEVVYFANPGESMKLELESMDRRTAFLLDINRKGRIKLSRCTLQERHRTVEILARLDLGGSKHTNPKVETPPLDILKKHNGRTFEVDEPHFHIYVEGYDARWAIPAAEAGFKQTTDLVLAFREFMIHCGVQDVPMIQYPLQ
ncbi:MAG: hypothetical protein LW822_07690 [Phycisphaeraceae bacterium]|jgi:hypothetical protein|nr:hypothetical protein [Phycisphaeraceae bacterium]